MKARMSLFISILAAASGSIILSGCAQAAPSAQSAYYVNFVHGDDERDGRSAATAWKHAPGDINARGRAAASTLVPGVTLFFAGGVRYRGELRLNGGGAAGAPIVLTTYGDEAAIIDGSDEVADARPCRSADDCGGATIWRQLLRVSFSKAAPQGAVLFSDAGQLYPAQSPNTEAIFYSDSAKEYFQVDAQELSQGRVKIPGELSQEIEGQESKQIAVWIYGNVIRVKDIIGVEGGMVRFDPAGMKFYTDRPGRVALLGHPALVDRPGEYAFIEGRQAAVVFMPPTGKSVSVASGRGGINLNGMSNVVIRGLRFTNMADNGVSARSGIGITSQGKPAGAILIQDNSFEYFRMSLGQGAITLRQIDGLTISGNQIRSVSLGSGMRLSRSNNVQVMGNTIGSINRTGIMLMDVKNALVSHNVISDAKGVHGNGMSVYLGNEDVRIVANTITESTRPMTYHGDGTGTTVNNITVANNLFVGTPSSSSALTSWGKDTRKVVVRHNVLLGGKFGLRLSQEDSDVIVAGNVLNGIALPKVQPESWELTANREVRFNPEAGLRGGFGKLVADAVSGDEKARKDLCAMFPRETSAPADSATSEAIGAKLSCASVATGTH